ncbi:MAG: HDOD domain-containing protein [Thermodesulfovibrionales bacterium]|nr:HDOD domain-containing protein [Thermodesulfovibrionales bacterium]
MDIKTIQSELQKIDTIPTIPDNFKKILRIIENPKASLSTICNFIINDQALTSRVLKMVNSPIYGFPGRISSVNQALLLLGLNAVRGLLLGISAFEIMQKAMAGLWEHSLATTITARFIAQKKGISDPEEVSVAGLLHDIGKVILIIKFPEEYEKVLRRASQEEVLIFKAEKEIFGITHAEAGAIVCRKWNFPQNLIEMVEYYHNPQYSQRFPLQTAIVHISDIIARAKGIGFAGDTFVPSINPVAWDKLSLTRENIKEILMHLEETFYETSSNLDSQ